MYQPPPQKRLGAGERWAELAGPARVRLPSGRELLAIPTTHSLGDLARCVLRPGGLPAVVHTYFHDTDLLDGRRRTLLSAALRLLARRATVTDLGALRQALGAGLPVRDWADVARS